MKKKTEATPLQPVESLAKAVKLPTWELAALRQATGWVDGKAVTQAEFDLAVDRLRSRQQGGGKI